jgi:hypothetical protein
MSLDKPTLNSIGADHMYFKNLLDNAACKMPFRMTLGKLGIRLMAIGRWLQVRYANWNGEFRLKFVPGGYYENNRGIFHVSQIVVTCETLTFVSKTSQQNKQTELVKNLFEIPGVDRITFHQYQIVIYKAEVFGWDEIRPQIEATILKHLTAAQR